MANKTKSIIETNAKFIINKKLAERYLDKKDYEKFIKITTMLKIYDIKVDDGLTFGNWKSGYNGSNTENNKRMV